MHQQVPPVFILFIVQSIYAFVAGQNVINDPTKCNNVLNVITFCPKCNKLLRVITLGLMKRPSVNIESLPTVAKFHNLIYSTKKTLLVNYFQKLK